MTKLKPCPFCGGVPLYDEFKDIYCETCSLSMMFWDGEESPEDHVKRWNRRATQEAEEEC